MAAGTEPGKQRYPPRVSATMGGGEEATEYWISSNGTFHPWAYINTCQMSPYWALSVNGTDDFENGGPT